MPLASRTDGSSGFIQLEGVWKGGFDVLRDGWVNGIVLALGARLFAGITRIVMILAGSASLQFSASGDFYFLADRLPGFELWHTR